MVGRSTEDELMLKEIAYTNTNNSKSLVIYDARSQIAAYANRLTKGGFENTNYYTNCAIEFLDIDNIHGVRDAISKVYDMSQAPSSNNSSKILT